jgi:galactoside O-acetyltransferase
MEFDYSKLKSVGQDVVISSNVEIKRPHLVTIDSHVAIDSGFYLTTTAKIGNYIHIGPHVSIIGGETAKFVMENFTSIAAGARLIVIGDEHLGFGLVGPTAPKEFQDKRLGGQIHLEKFASIGTNAVVMPGLRLAEGSVIGAGSVLTKDTEPWTIYVGVPAKPIKLRDSTKMVEYARILEETNLRTD